MKSIIITLVAILTLAVTSCKKDPQMVVGKNTTPHTTSSVADTVTLVANYGQEYVYLKRLVPADTTYIWQPYVTTHSLTVVAHTGDSIKVAFYPAANKPGAGLVVTVGTVTLTPVKKDTMPPSYSYIYYKL